MTVTKSNMANVTSEAYTALGAKQVESNVLLFPMLASPIMHLKLSRSFFRILVMAVLLVKAISLELLVISPGHHNEG